MVKEDSFYSKKKFNRSSKALLSKQNLAINVCSFYSKLFIFKNTTYPSLSVEKKLV